VNWRGKTEVLEDMGSTDTIRGGIKETIGDVHCNSKPKLFQGMCQTGRLEDWQTGRLADWQIGRLAVCTARQADWQTGRHADMQTNGQVDK
jgi:hypothetical protein